MLWEFHLITQGNITNYVDDGKHNKIYRVILILFLKVPGQ